MRLNDAAGTLNRGTSGACLGARTSNARLGYSDNPLIVPIKRF